MAVKLNEQAFEHAKKLIKDGRCVADDRDAWSEHQLTARDENEFSTCAACSTRWCVRNDVRSIPRS